MRKYKCLLNDQASDRANGKTTVELFWVTGPFIREDLLKRTNLANISPDRYLLNANSTKETNAVTAEDAADAHVLFNSTDDYASFEQELQEYAMMAETSWVSKLLN